MSRFKFHLFSGQRGLITVYEPRGAATEEHIPALVAVSKPFDEVETKLERESELLMSFWFQFVGGLGLNLMKLFRKIWKRGTLLE